MACRVGITTDPKRREEEWKRKHPNLSGWQILEICQTKSEAQDLENAHIEAYGCEGSSGGAGDEDKIWYVYIFNY